MGGGGGGGGVPTIGITVLHCAMRAAAAMHTCTYNVLYKCACHVEFSLCVCEWRPGHSAPCVVSPIHSLLSDFVCACLATTPGPGPITTTPGPGRNILIYT